MQNTIKKIRCIFSFKAVKIVGLILFVSAQAYPLSAFEAHVISVTARIERPPVRLTADTILGEENFSATSDILGAADFVEGSDAADSLTGAEAATESSGDTAADSDSASVNPAGDAPTTETPTTTPEVTTTPEPTIVAPTESADSVAPSPEANLVPDIAPAQSEAPEATVTMLEITNADSSLIIENSGAFSEVSSEQVSGDQVAGADEATL